MLLDGENSRVNSDLGVKTVVFYIRKTVPTNALIIGLSGLRNGYWNGRLIRL